MERIRLGHDDITIHVDGKQSGGTMLAAEVTIPAGGGPPAMHHHPSGEVYRVERGELALYVGDQRVRATEGAVVHIPGGVAHTVRNETKDAAQAFVVFTPGTEMEGFVRAVAGSPDGDVMAIAAAHGIELAS
jgi:mannose-6-phosphate isomerase-like protein (cupin superfamily)